MQCKPSSNVRSLHGVCVGQTLVGWERENGSWPGLYCGFISTKPAQHPSDHSSHFNSMYKMKCTKIYPYRRIPLNLEAICCYPILLKWALDPAKKLTQHSARNMDLLNIFPRCARCLHRNTAASAGVTSAARRAPKLLFWPINNLHVQVWTQIGIAMSTLNTVGMQSLKRLCISNQWNPKRSQQTQLQGIKCMVPFFQSQTFERRFPCCQDIWGTDFRTSGGANKTVTEICNQSGKALLTAHHVTRRFPKALHMTQATASMGIRLDSETTQMNTQKPKQEWKKITLSQSCLIFEDITTTRSKYHYYGSPGFQVVNDLIISGKTGEKFWCDVPFVEHCLQQRPRIQVLRTVVQARLSHRKHKPTIATLHCNMDMMSQVWNFQVIFHGEHVWSKPWTCNIAGQIWQPWLKSKHRFQV